MPTDNGRVSIKLTSTSAAVHANGFKAMAPWIQSTGFRTHALRLRALGMFNGPRSAETFLVNSVLRRDDRESETSIESYFTDTGVVMLSMLDKEESNGFRDVALPEAAPVDMSLGDAISWRRSTRSYTGDPIDMRQLSALVVNAAGVTSHADVSLSDGSETTLHLRATPSGGGLYPVHLYVAALRVERLTRGIYRYDPIRHKLSQVGQPTDADALIECFAVSDDALALSRACAIFIMVGTPWRAMRKYGDRGMRYVFLEAGAMAEHINLTAAALGLGSVDCASIYEDEAHEVLELDGVHNAVVHTVVVGVPG